VKGRCTGIERQNSLAKFFEKSSLTLYRGLKLLWSEKLYVDWCPRKEESRLALLPVGVWQLKRIRQNSVKGRYHLYLEKEEAKHVLLDCIDTRSWIMKWINGEWLNMNKEVAYRKILKSTTKERVKI
jgi:hypothetical protein